MQGQIQTCINLLGQVKEALQADPGMKRPVRTGPGMTWLRGLTFRQGRCVVELLQRLRQFLRLSLLNKGLKSGELLQDRGRFVPTGYTAQKVLHRPRAETELVDRQRCWRSAGEARKQLSFM